MFSKKNLSLKNLIFVAILAIVGLLVALPSFTKKETGTTTPKTEINKQALSQTSTDQTAEVVPLREEVEEPKSPAQTKVQGAQTQTSFPVSNPTPATEAPVTKTVTLNINAKSFGSYTYKISWVNGDTSWSILKRASEENHFHVEYDDHSWKSVYVKDIYDTNCECWEYEVNGKTPGGIGAGASEYKVNENDIITWKKVS